MKELQAKAKVTQTMTRDGLVVENQADGTVENVSSREAEQDYSTDAEGKAEKILERAEDIKDGHKNKKKAKKAAETAVLYCRKSKCFPLYLCIYKTFTNFAPMQYGDSTLAP